MVEILTDLHPVGFRKVGLSVHRPTEDIQTLTNPLWTLYLIVKILEIVFAEASGEQLGPILFLHLLLLLFLGTFLVAFLMVLLLVGAAAAARLDSGLLARLGGNRFGPDEFRLHLHRRKR